MKKLVLKEGHNLILSIFNRLTRSLLLSHVISTKEVCNNNLWVCLDLALDQHYSGVSLFWIYPQGKLIVIQLKRMSQFKGCLQLGLRWCNRPSLIPRILSLVPYHYKRAWALDISLNIFYNCTHEKLCLRMVIFVNWNEEPFEQLTWGLDQWVCCALGQSCFCWRSTLRTVDSRQGGWRWIEASTVSRPSGAG